MYPNLIIPGSPKCGSSTFHHYLNTHPQIEMSTLKEPSIFLNKWEGTEASYSHYFPQQKSNPKYYGESTIAYLTYPEVPERIKQVAPQARFIFVLRDPVLRTYSHYWHRVKGGNEHRSWEDALKGDQKEYLFDYSFYYRHISTFLQYFDLNQCYFVILEEFEGNEVEAMNKVYDFLQLPHNRSEKAAQVVNRGYQPRSKSINQLMLRMKKQRKWAGVVPGFVKPLIHKTVNFLNNSNKKDYTYNQISEKHVQFLKDLYIDDVRALQKLLNRDLPWLTTYPDITQHIE